MTREVKPLQSRGCGRSCWWPKSSEAASNTKAKRLYRRTNRALRSTSNARADSSVRLRHLLQNWPEEILAKRFLRSFSCWRRSSICSRRCLAVRQLSTRPEWRKRKCQPASTVCLQTLTVTCPGGGALLRAKQFSWLMEYRETYFPARVCACASTTTLTTKPATQSKCQLPRDSGTNAGYDACQSRCRDFPTERTAARFYDDGVATSEPRDAVCSVPVTSRV